MIRCDYAWCGGASCGSGRTGEVRGGVAAFSPEAVGKMAWCPSAAEPAPDSIRSAELIAIRIAGPPASKTGSPVGWHISAMPMQAGSGRGWFAASSGCSGFSARALRDGLIPRWRLPQRAPHAGAAGEGVFAHQRCALLAGAGGKLVLDERAGPHRASGHDTRAGSAMVAGMVRKAWPAGAGQDGWQRDGKPTLLTLNGTYRAQRRAGP